MSAIIRLKFEDGQFIPLDPVVDLCEGDVLAFQLPDPNVVYLCETDRLAAIERGMVVLLASGKEGEAFVDG